jgi:HEAT repeat protein
LKAAGLLGLGRVGGTEAVGILIAALDNPAPDLRQAARTALVQASPDLQDALIDVLSTATPRTRRGILEVMGLRRDPSALPTLRAAARDSDPEIVATAATALGTMRDQDSALLLGELATRGPAQVRPVALRAYLNVMSAARSSNQVATGYEWGLRNATRDEERIQALRGLAGVGGPSALPGIEPYLVAGPLQPEAIAALLGIADRLAAAGRKENAVTLYRRALALTADKGVRRRAATRLRGLGLPVDLAADDGFLTRWWALGPLAGRTRWAQEDALNPEEAIDPAKPIKVEEKDYPWKAVPVTDPDGMLDLEKSVARQDDAVAYLYTEVTSPKAQDVSFKIGSDDGFVLWVNGRKAGEFKGDRAYAVDSSTIAAHLEAGVNRILVKVTQGAGQWAAAVRLTSPGGSPLRLDQIKLP